jgi:hypothetical protein
LDNLETKVTGFFEKYSELAKKAFEDYVAQRMAYYKAVRYGDALGGARWLKDLFMGLPDEVNEFFVDGRQKFMNKMEEGIEIIAEYVATELTRAKARIQRGRASVNNYVESLPKNLQHLGKEAAEEIQDKFTALDDDVNSREESLIDSLAQQYMSTLEEVDERIEEMKEANKGLIDAALGFINGVIETILKLKEMIVNLFSAIKSVIGVIMEDPIGFMENLFDGIGQGIDAFKANIQTHMLGGLITWLTGSLGPMGITLPEDIFSLKGIFSLVMQVLGLSWDFIRQKAVMMMGEPMVNALTKGYDMFTTFATQGVMGIWEYLKDQFTDLKETVIEAIKGMLITQVIEAGIKWLFSLLIPGAGFIKAIMAIKDLIVFFVEAAMMLIPAVTEAILALAAGSVAGVAIAIEKGLSMLIALVINLFAKLIGLGGLTKKVMAIFKKIRKRVDRAIMKLLNKAKKAGRKLMAKLGIGGKEKPKNKKEHDEQVKSGLDYIDQLSNQEDKEKDGKIDEESATAIANKTKKKFKVFTDVKPRLEGDIWVYDWTGSKGTKKSKKKTYPLSPEIKQLIKDLKGLPGSQSLVSYLKSKKIMPWFKHGFKTQAERAIHYNQKGQLINIEERFEDKSKTPSVVSRFDLKVKDVDSSGKDTGEVVVIEVKNWTGFENLDAKTKDKRLNSLENQLVKYKTSQQKVRLEWKGIIPNSVLLLCEKLNVERLSI